MEDITHYRLNKLEDKLDKLEKDVSPLVEKQKIWNDTLRLVIAAIVGASAREIISFVLHHISIH